LVSGVSAGHYTAYAKHPLNSEWHSFNDETVTHQKPQDEDFSYAYILFYQKQGKLLINCSNFDFGNDLQLIVLTLLPFIGVAFPELNLEEPMKPNIDHLIERLDSTMDQDMGQEMS